MESNAPGFPECKSNNSPAAKRNVRQQGGVASKRRRTTGSCLAVEIISPIGRALTGFLELQIQLQIFNLRKTLMPFAGRFDVHRTKVFMALAEQFGDGMAADEAAGACD